MTVPHAALAPSGQPIWLDVARRSAIAVTQMLDAGRTMGDLITEASIRNAMTVHAAVGGSTNLLLHIPALAFAAKQTIPTIELWNEINRSVPRFVDVLPNGPRNHPTVQLFMAGGVPEVMLHLQRKKLIDDSALTCTGLTWKETLETWEKSDRRKKLRQQLIDKDGIDPDDVILSPSAAATRGLTSTVCFPVGNLCPQGSVIKATAIDPSVIDEDGVYRKVGRAPRFYFGTISNRCDQRPARTED